MTRRRKGPYWVGRMSGQLPDGIRLHRLTPGERFVILGSSGAGSRAHATVIGPGCAGGVEIEIVIARGAHHKDGSRGPARHREEWSGLVRVHPVRRRARR